MSLNQCGKCEDFHLTKTCNCEQYIVVDEDGGEHPIYALDAEKAVEKFAEIHNKETEYSLLNSQVTVSVLGVNYYVSAYEDIVYSVNIAF